MRSIEITPAEAGQRLDRFLRKLLPTTPLGGIFKMLRRGAIRVDGSKARPELRLEAGMQLSVPLAIEVAAVPTPDGKPRPAGPEPRIVHRDDDLLVVDKPAGLAVQPGSGFEHSLVSWLDHQPFVRRTATFRPGPAHRLDRGTSGLVAIGLTPAAARELAAAFREDRVDKVYVAIVAGVPEPSQGVVDAPLLLRENARLSQPKVVVDARGKPARTSYEVVARGEGRAQLRVGLHTGRRHQIRAHLAHLGHPIVGDGRYGSRIDLGRGVFLLHAAELSLPHPVTDERMAFAAPLPAAFRAR